MTLPFLLAAFSNPSQYLYSAGKTTTLYSKDIFVVLAGTLIAAMLILIWAVFFRRSGHRHEHHRRHRHRDSSTKTSPSVTDSSGGEAEDEAATTETNSSERHRRRRLRRQHRQRNPTLAETGGLPPTRDPETPPPMP